MPTKPFRKFIKQALPDPVVDGLRALRDFPARSLQTILDRCGYVIARKADYYSPLPSRKSMKSTMPRWSAPNALSGVQYDLPQMKATLKGLIEAYMSEFLALRPYEECLNLGFGPGYPRFDAMVLYSMLRTHKPSRYVEVGSGLSTYYASLAAERNGAEGHPMQITCIEPYPYPALSTIPGIKLMQQEVQSAPLEIFTSLGANDVLFIDSSHIVRLDGDVPFLFLDVLPVLPAGPLIHIHDIPFPYHCPYPPKFWIYDRLWPMWWNESMLLHALLCGNRELEIVLSTPLIRHTDEAFLQQLILGYKTVEQETNIYSSIWLKKRSV